ncbi:MAG TPA: rhodanese-like domain-containing protein [Candidatus Limnocylindrales bacterium]
MANQSRKGFDRSGAAGAGKSAAGKAAGKPKPRPATASSGRSRTLPAIVGVIVVAAIALGGIFLATRGTSGSATAGTLVQSSNGAWTNITPDRLASELKQHQFTLLNVKTPYIGEIDGTDLYIPYTELTARAVELPTDKTAKIVVYCRSGAESAIASQTLLNLGYTNIENLDGGMNAWTASGRSLVQKNRI